MDKCLYISSVLLSLQSLLQPIPIQNEPGWEKETIKSEKSISYNKTIEHQKYKIAILNVLKNPEKYGLKDFQSLIYNHFVNNYNIQREKLVQLAKEFPNGTEMQSNIYSVMRFSSTYENLLNEYDSEYHRIKNLISNNKFYLTIKINEDDCINTNKALCIEDDEQNTEDKFTKVETIPEQNTEEKTTNNKKIVVKIKSKIHLKKHLILKQIMKWNLTILFIL